MKFRGGQSPTSEQELHALGLRSATKGADALTFHFTNRDERWRRVVDPSPGSEVLTFDGEYYEYVDTHWHSETGEPDGA